MKTNTADATVLTQLNRLRVSEVTITAGHTRVVGCHLVLVATRLLHSLHGHYCLNIDFNSEVYTLNIMYKSICIYIIYIIYSLYR